MEIKDTDTVIYLANDELARSYRWYKSYEGLSESLKVVSLDDLPTLIKQGFFFGSQKEGSILIRNPFRKNGFIDINTSEEQIIKEKIGAISKIARKLGAKMIHGHAEFIEESRIELTIDGGLSYKTVDINANYKKEQNESLKKLYNLSLAFPGSWSETTYTEAHKLLDEYNLSQEIEVRDLFDLRNPNEQNNLEKQTVRMSVTSELNSCKEVAASLTVMKDIFKMSGSTKKNVSTLKTIVFESEIQF